jgi:hypothetical protein
MAIERGDVLDLLPGPIPYSQKYLPLWNAGSIGYLARAGIAVRTTGNHSLTTVALVTPSAISREQSHYAEMELLLKHALVIDEKVLGPDHPSAARNLNNLALLYDPHDHCAEAELLYKRRRAKSRT